MWERAGLPFPRLPCVRNQIGAGTERFEEEAFGCFGIAFWTQEKFQCVSLRIHRSVQIRPDFFDFDVRLIDFPRISASFQARSTAFLQLWGIMLDPPIDGCVVNWESTLTYDLFEISITDRIS